MDHGTKIFRVFDIDIYLHYSWWLVFIILTWSLATGFFPAYFPALSVKEDWLIGVAAALLLFVSVLLHELSHSLVARAKKIKVDSITLFFFGGVAGISKEDMKPSSEFLMAIAGPLFSLVLAGLFYLLFRWDGNVFVTAISLYLYQLNLVLALFNLVPGYPLDGGRAFRALLYGYYHDLKKATKIAAGAGKFVAAVLFFLGVFSLFAGLGNGLWFMLLGGFLYLIAGTSYEQVVIKETLSSIPLKSFSLVELPLLSSDLTVKQFCTQSASSGKSLFLVQDGQFQGFVDLHLLGPMSLKLQGVLKLKQVAIPFSHFKPLQLKDNAYTAFKSFLEQQVDVLPLVDKKKNVGVLTREAVMNRLLFELKFTDPHLHHVIARMHRHLRRRR